MQNIQGTERKTIANTGFASGGLTPKYRGRLCKLGALCF